FNGDCRSAFELYARALGGTIAYMSTYGESPIASQVDANWREKIYQATLVVGTSTIAGADVQEGQYERPKGFSLMASPADPVEAQRMFDLLAEGGTIQMQIQQTHWAAAFGVVVDRFGISWEINCESVPASA